MAAIAIPRRSVLAGLLAALAMFGPFCIDAIFPAFPAIAAQFRAGAPAMQQTISVYLLVYALMSLVLGALSDAWGRRAVTLGCVSVFLMASVGCAMAQSMPVLLMFRGLQGACAGVGLIVGRAIVRDCFEGAEAQKLMAHISMIFGVAPALAPVVGAWLVMLGGWHALFWVLSAFAALLLLLCLGMLPETHPRASRIALSPRGLLSTYREILTDSQFIPLALTLTFSVGGLLLYVTNAPAFVLRILQLDTHHFPWLFVPAISGLVLGSTLAARLAGRVNARVLLGAGYAIMLGAALLGVLVAWQMVPARVPWAVLPLALGGVGINLIAPTINLLVLDRFPRHRGAASSVQAFVTLAFYALLAGVIGPWLGDNALHFALAALGLYACGFAAWRWYRTVAKRAPPAGSIERELLDDTD
ncbi:MAG: multidrug effflux MFS transporter [Rudaea sp.]|nr:multidrug effflux MFS transporter [Rudaea sp.]